MGQAVPLATKKTITMKIGKNLTHDTAERVLVEIKVSVVGKVLSKSNLFFFSFFLGRCFRSERVLNVVFYVCTSLLDCNFIFLQNRNSSRLLNIIASIRLWSVLCSFSHAFLQLQIFHKCIEICSLSNLYLNICYFLLILISYNEISKCETECIILYREFITNASYFWLGTVCAVKIFFL